MNPAHQISQNLLKEINGTSFLELGYKRPKVFAQVECPLKVGVDPGSVHPHDVKDTDSVKLIRMTSDEFFEQNDRMFDVILVDGLHLAGQFKKDIYNSLAALNENGYIVCPHVNPPDEEYQVVPFTRQHAWAGDIWKTWVELRSTESKLQMMCVDVKCCGCGVISRGEQKLLDLQGAELVYKNLDKNRKEWLNLIDYKDYPQYLY